MPSTVGYSYAARILSWCPYFSAAHCTCSVCRSFSVDLRKAEKYAGHYLFLVDYDDQTEEALYLDPSLVSTEPQRVALSTLEAAFSEPGTDHDIIVINNS